MKSRPNLKLTDAQLFRIIGIVFFVLLNITCYGQKNEYIIEGHVDQSYNGKYIQLFSYRGGEMISPEKAMVSNGSFSFRGKCETKDVSVITTCISNGNHIMAGVILEPGKIIVRMDSISEVKGGRLNSKYQAYIDSCRIFQERIETINSRLSIVRRASDSIRLEKLKEMYADYNRSVVISNLDNAIAVTAFRNCMYDIPDSYFDELLKLVGREIRCTPDIMKYISARSSQNLKNAFIGKEIADFNLVTIKGANGKISDYIGDSEYLFIDFWASWCGPCKSEIPGLKKVYSDFKDKGFDILSISIDRDRKAWTDAVKGAGLPWNNLIVPKELEVMVKDSFRIKSVPHTLLIDRKGRIVDVNLSGSTLSAALSVLIEN